MPASEPGYVIYAGDQKQQRSLSMALSWKDIKKFILEKGLSN